MRIILCAAFTLAVAPTFAQSLEPPPLPPGVSVSAWALPQSAAHRQVAPPPDFHRPPRTLNKAIGIFENSTDVGAALAPGSASYDPAARRYRITAAGYNIWYNRDEFHFLWKKMSGDVSLAASVPWTDIREFHDRKVALMIRDSLDDDSRAITAAQHGNGMVHIAWRGTKNGAMTDVEYRASHQARPSDTQWTAIHPTRFGIEKKGDRFQLYVSWQGEALHPEGAPVIFKTNGPFYVGIGFTSHLPANPLTAIVSDVVLENAAGKVR